MVDTINSYNSLLNIIYQFYLEIKDNISFNFDGIIDNDKLNINFYRDFEISENFTEGFIFYNAASQKFFLSLPNGISKYDKIRNVNPINLVDIDSKLKNGYYSYFSNEEIAQIIKKYNIDFKSYIKYEFLRQYIKKIICLKGTRKLYYFDDYVKYTENIGFKLNDIIIEMEARLFASKFGLFYLPNSVGNINILKIIHLVCINNHDLIINGNIDKLLDELPYFFSNKLFKFEEREFELKYHLHKNSLNNV